MIIKQDGLYHKVFIRLLGYLNGPTTNQFWLVYMDPVKLQQSFTLEIGEKLCLIGDEGAVRPFLRSFVRLKSVTIEYKGSEHNGSEMYCSVAIEIPDEVTVGVISVGGSLKKDFNRSFPVTSNRIMLEIWNILKGLDSD